MKIQIVGGKVCFICIGKTLLEVVNKLLKTKGLLTMPSNVFPLHPKQTFPPMIWIFTEGEGDWIKSRLPFKIFFHFTKGLMSVINKKKRDNLTYFLYLISEPVEPKSWIGWNHIESFECTHKWTNIKVPIPQICSNKIRQFCLGIMSWQPREIQKCWQTGRVANFWVCCLHTRVYLC